MSKVCLSCGRPAPAKVANVEVNVDRLTALEAVAEAAVGVQHYRVGSVGMVEIDSVVWQKIVTALNALDALDALDAAQQPAAGDGGAELT